VIFRGWWIVLVSIVGLSLSVGTMIAYTFGVFAKPLATEFHASRGQIALAVSLMDIVVLFVAPGAGRLADRYGARGIITGSLLSVSACLLALAYVQRPVWHLYVLYILAGVVGTASTPVTFSRVVANWFDRRRGLALGVASCGIGVGAFIMPSLAQFLIDKGGWRLAYIGLAALCFTVAAPTVWFFLRTTPEEVGCTQDGIVVGAAKSREKLLDGMTVREALRTPTLWLLCGIFYLVAACVNGTNAHLAPLLTDRGISGTSAALAASIFGGATILGRVLNGFLIDRFFGPRVAAGLFTAGAIGVAMLWLGISGIGIFASAALLGLATGAEADVMPYLISRYFGMRCMAELFGIAFGFYTLGNASGRYLYAAGFDAFGSYKIPLMFGFAAIMLAIAACFALGKYRRSMIGLTQ
jgi:sugar phosphate permease